MAQKPLITDAVRAMIGQETVTTHYISREDIKKLAIAVDDLNPLYLDAKFAGKSRYGGIIALPLQIFMLVNQLAPQSEISFDGKAPGYDPPMDYAYSVMGGADIEFFTPIRAGDTITGRAKITDIVERQSSQGGWIAIVTRETTFSNQKGDAVAIQKMTSIYR
jgi:acyl dehydratase